MHSARSTVLKKLLPFTRADNVVQNGILCNDEIICRNDLFFFSLHNSCVVSITV